MDQTARFVRWGVKADSGGPCLTMTVMPEGKNQKPVVITIPNKTRKSRVANPPDSVAQLAGQLKIGDKVRVKYDQVKTAQTLKSANLVESASPADKPVPFTFESVRKVRHGKADYQAVAAGRGGMSWAFLMPNVEAGASLTDSGSAGGRKIRSQPTPDPALVQKVRKYRRGDEVYLTYVPFEYTFALKDIQTAQRSAEGVFQASRQTTQSGKTVQTLHVLAAERSILLFVPTGAEAGGDSAGKLLAAVKALKPRQKVTLKYRTEGGINWLDEISAR